MPLRQSRIEMLLDSSGKTLSAGSASRDQSYPIMGRSLTAWSIGTFAKIEDKKLVLHPLVPPKQWPS